MELEALASAIGVRPSSPVPSLLYYLAVFFVSIEVKCSKEVATSNRNSRWYHSGEAVSDPGEERLCGNKIGKPHTVPSKVTEKCGSVTVRMVSAARGVGIVAARVLKKMLQFAGIDDVFTSSRGSTKTLGNFVKDGTGKNKPSREADGREIIFNTTFVLPLSFLLAFFTPNHVIMTG